MNLNRFLEATAEYIRLRAVQDGEKAIVDLEKRMAVDVSRFFRRQGLTFLKHLPETFDQESVARAWDQTRLETYLIFRDLLIKHGRRAAYVGIRTLEKELAASPIQEAAKRSADPFRISFDEFDQDAYNQIEQHAGEKITKIDETTRNNIHDIVTRGFQGDLQPDGTTKYKSYQQIAKEIKDKFDDFTAPAIQSHIRNRAELVAITEIRDGYETSKAGVRDKLEARGWNIEKRWSNMGDNRVSAGCRDNGNAGWIDNKSSFPSGTQQPPRFPGCRCNCQSRVGGRKEQSGLPQDRWIVTRDGDTVTVKRNPKYDLQNVTKQQIKPSIPINAQDNFSKILEEKEKEISQLAHERLYSIDDDGNILLSKDGTHNRIGFTGDELKKFKGATITHNHPSGWNSFSPADIQTACHSECKEVRATTKYYRHVMTSDQGNFTPSLWKQIEPEYVKADKDVKTEFWDAIQKGTMSPSDAEHNHFHEVWTQVSKNVTGLNYRRDTW